LAAQLTFSYDSLDRLAGISRSAGVGSHVISSSYSYDGANRLTGISYADATTNTPLASFTYGYNADGQVASYTSPEGTLNYSNDKDGELTGVSGVAQASYSYDANGNRTMSGYQTGPGNELLNDGQFTYTYDKDSNLLSKRDASGDDVGIQASAGDMTAETLTADVIRQIRRVLPPRRPVILLGCGQGANRNTRELARRLSRPAIANTGEVSVTGVGEGNWVVFRP
jgi:YD repeat-containing protein